MRRLKARAKLGSKLKLHWLCATFLAVGCSSQNAVRYLVPAGEVSGDAFTIELVGDWVPKYPGQQARGLKTAKDGVFLGIDNHALMTIAFLPDDGSKELAQLRKLSAEMLGRMRRRKSFRSVSAGQYSGGIANLSRPAPLDLRIPTVIGTLHGPKGFFSIGVATPVKVSQKELDRIATMIGSLQLQL